MDGQIFQLSGVSFVCLGRHILDTLGTPHTADNLLDIVKEEKRKIEAEFEVHVKSMVADNAQT